MKAETEPIGPDEWLIRLVEGEYLKPPGVVISLKSFEPRGGRNPDVNGISLFRLDCLNAPADALAVVAAEKRGRKGLVQVPVILLGQLGGPTGIDLMPAPDPIPEVPGHVVVPGLNISAFQTSRQLLAPIILELARVATHNILLRPAAGPPA